MNRIPVFVLAVLAASCAGRPGEHFRPKGLYNNALHRFFPDLDSRENAVRYARWRAFDRPGRAPGPQFVSAAVTGSAREPSWPPDPRLCAPRLAREEPGTFRRLVAAEELERGIVDALAASDASPRTTPGRIARAVEHYRQVLPNSPAPALAPPAAPVSPAARWLAAGETLFVRAAENLTGPGYAEQRWLVRDEVNRFDRDIRSVPPLPWPSYAEMAPSFARAYPEAAALLDRGIALRASLLESAR